MNFIHAALLAIASTTLLSACATTRNTIADVPKINPERIQVPAMSALPHRDVALTIVDSRSPVVKDKSLELRSELERSTTSALTRTGINVTAISNNALTLTVQDYSTEKFAQGCVKINGTLVIPKKAKLASDASSCYEMKTPMGGRLMSADITKAYEEALSLVFKNLDEAMGKMQTL